jgi:hypothetical protein
MDHKSTLDNNSQKVDMGKRDRQRYQNKLAVSTQAHVFFNNKKRNPVSIIMLQEQSQRMQLRNKLVLIVWH